MLGTIFQESRKSWHFELPYQQDGVLAVLEASLSNLSTSSATAKSLH